MKSIGLVTPFLVAGAAARLNKLNGRDIITIGPDGTCCPAAVTVQLQPVYYSEVFKYPTQIDPFHVGETVTVSACPFTIITSRTLTTTITGTLPPGCPTTTPSSTTASSASSNSVSVSPGLGSTSSSSSSSSASSSTSASTQVSGSTSVTSAVTTASPSVSPLSQFFLAYTSLPVAKRGEEAGQLEKRQILPGQTASPVTVVDLIGSPTPTANAVLPAGCRNATLFTINAGVLAIAGTENALAKQVGAVQAVLGTLIDPTPNEVNTTFSINAGVVTWVASDGTGQANFFACANGVVAGFPSYAVDGCVQVQLRTFGLNECSSAQQSSTTSSSSTSITSASSGQITSSSSSQSTTSSSSSSTSSVSTSSTSSSSSASTTETTSFSTLPPFGNTTTSSTVTSTNTNDDTLTSTQSSSSSTQSTSSTADTATTTSSSSSPSSSSASTSEISTTSTSSIASSSSSADVTGTSSSSSTSVSDSGSSSTSSTTAISGSLSSSSSSSVTDSSSSASLSTSVGTTSPTASTESSSATSSVSSSTASTESGTSSSATSTASSLQSSSTSAISSSVITETSSATASTSVLSSSLSSASSLTTSASSSQTSSSATTVISSGSSSSVTTIISSGSSSSATTVVPSLSSSTVSSGSSTRSSTTPSASPTCVLNLPSVCLTLSGTSGISLILPATQCRAAFLQVLNVSQLPAALNCLTLGTLGIGTGNDILTCIANGGILCPATSSSSSVVTISSSSASTVPSSSSLTSSSAFSISSSTQVSSVSSSLSSPSASLTSPSLTLSSASGSTTASTSASASPTCVVNIPGVCLTLSGQTGLSVFVPAIQCQAALESVLNVPALPGSLNCLTQAALGLGGASGDDILICIANSGILCPATPTTTGGSSSTASLSSITSTASASPTCVVNLPGVCLSLAGTTGLSVILPAAQCQAALLQVLNVPALPPSLACLVDGALGIGGDDGDDILVCIANSGILCPASPTSAGSTTAASSTATASIVPSCVANLPGVCLSLAGTTGLSVIAPAAQCQVALLQVLNVAVLPASLNCLVDGALGIGGDGDDILVCIANSGILCAASPTSASSASSASATASLIPVPLCVPGLPASCLALSGSTGLSLLLPAAECVLSLQTALNVVTLPSSLACLLPVNIGLDTDGDDLLACIAGSGILCPAPSGSSTSATAPPTTSPTPGCATALPTVCTNLVNDNGLSLIGGLATCLTAISGVVDPTYFIAAQSCLDIIPTILTTGVSVVQCLTTNVLCVDGEIPVLTPSSTTSASQPTATSIINTGCIADLPTDCADLASLEGLALILPAGTCLTQLTLTNLDSPALVRAASCLTIGNINILTDGQDLVDCLESSIVCTSGGTVPTPTTTGPSPTSSAIVVSPTSSTIPVLDCLAQLPASCSSLVNLTGLTLIGSTATCLLGLQSLPNLSPVRLLAATTCINNLNPLGNPQGTQLIACLNTATLCT